MLWTGKAVNGTLSAMWFAKKPRFFKKFHDGRTEAVLNPSAFARASFAQEGEDLILARMFEAVTDGFYVDVGAHHPFRFSNTYLLYQQGWRGINIDPCPGSAALFDAHRTGDVNLEMAVSDEEGAKSYYIFNELALNTLSKEYADLYKTNPMYKITSEIEIPTERLANVLSKHLPERREFRLLNVDVEGHDLQVLKSNDWVRFRPEVVVVEDLQNASLDKIVVSSTYEFLRDKGYSLSCRTINSSFYRKES
jgi:FkbM family methyltransferase